MPYERYRKDLQREDFHHDAAQERVILRLQRVYDELLTASSSSRPANYPSTGLLRRFIKLGKRDAPPQGVRGLYIWGGVGRGKTYLVDTFFDALPLSRKMRIHFHRFMSKIHNALRDLREQQNPLRTVACQFGREAQVICLDEFFVSDITDAMLLATLIRELITSGVTLVITSNIAPDELYQNGLQRARFLPAIELIKQNMDIIHIDDGVDYRLRYLEKAEIYHFPLDDQAERILSETFDHLSPEPGQRGTTLEIEGRPIPTRRLADGLVWFDFEAICDGPRSQKDYIEIARCFHTVMISNITVMDWQMEDQARRFLNLVDEFYDHNVKLIVSADARPVEIYGGKKLQFEYRRTVSRLQEMQSHDYLARQHLSY
jgi:cell division protein ZapE